MPRTHLSHRIIQWLCKEELTEEILGNLEEYSHRKNTGNNKISTFNYWIQVLSYLRPGTLKIISTDSKFGSMFIFNPALTIRNLYRHKTTTLINLSGFILGILSIIFIFFYTKAELQYDTFHTNKDSIYRVLRTSSTLQEPYDIGVTSGPYAEALVNDFPNSIKASTRAFPRRGLIELDDNQVFFEENLMFADANFFAFFSYPLINGRPESVLTEPNSVVLSQEIADKYFGDENPIGKILVYGQRWTFEVTGIMDDFPAQSHLEFDMVFNIENFKQYNWFDDWWSNGLITYVMVEHPGDVDYLAEQFPLFMDKYFAEDFKRSGGRMGLKMEALSDIYFNDQTRFDEAKHGNYKSLMILVAVGFAILFIACFNFVNLSIAQSFKRSKEVSIRKILGSDRKRLLAQFIGESLVIIIFSFIVALLLSVLLINPFNNAFGLNVVLIWADTSVLYFFAMLVSILVIISGIYPALQMVSFPTLRVLKQGSVIKGGRTSLRKALVTAQFITSIFLIAVTLLIFFQLQYVNKKELGFDKESIMVVNMNHPEIREQSELWESELQQHASILSYSGMSGEPGGFHDATVLEVPGLEKIRVRTLFTDQHYLKTFDINVEAGRGFSEDISTDASGVMLINEAALNALGIKAEEILGKKVTLPSWNNLEATLIGIVEDYHFSSLKDKIEPLIIVTGGYHRRYAIKFSSNDAFESLNFVEGVWKKLSPKYPMEYDFLDEKLTGLYDHEMKQSRVFTTFSGISILLACLGILGLATYAAQQRQKEFGIRKVLGASAIQVIKLISSEFMVLMLISIVIAIPLSWVFMQNWLDDFAYRISLKAHWFVFISAGLITILVAFVTIMIRTYQTAIANPSDSIKYE